MKDRFILLGFDLEEFDMPLEYNSPISFEDQLRYTDEGMNAIMPVISLHNTIVTFFTTAQYALHRKSLIKELAKTHEIASHTYYHTAFEDSHLLQSRLVLEEISGLKVEGLRMPRMRKVSLEAVKQAGYFYDSSIHPTILPGRYNNLDKPRTLYKENGILRLPASVSPTFRIPLFWLAFKNFPFAFYKYIAKQTLAKDGYLCLYYHPWEFTNLIHSGIPKYTRTIDGKVFTERLEQLIIFLKKEGEFLKTVDFVKNNSTTIQER